MGERFADKLPKTPNRTAPGPLLVRVVMGGLVGAIVAAGLNGSEFEGIILGVGGALIGTFGGFLVRREVVLRFGSKDWPVALVEDLAKSVFSTNGKPKSTATAKKTSRRS